MRTVYKYTLSLGNQVIVVPGDFRFLSVGPDPGPTGEMCIWALVDPDCERVGREILVVGTGHKIEAADNLDFVGRIDNPPFVWHVFARRVAA